MRVVRCDPLQGIEEGIKVVNLALGLFLQMYTQISFLRARMPYYEAGDNSNENTTTVKVLGLWYPNVEKCSTIFNIRKKGMQL